jgi:predicted GIY-YIG superfamily endonuclease
MTGIYVLKTSKHFYIGLSSDLNKRKSAHLSKLKKNIHPNSRLQNVYNKGYKIEFEIIQECEIEDLNRLEIL